MRDWHLACCGEERRAGWAAGVVRRLGLDPLDESKMGALARGLYHALIALDCDRFMKESMTPATPAKTLASARRFEKATWAALAEIDSAGFEADDYRTISEALTRHVAIARLNCRWHERRTRRKAGERARHTADVGINAFLGDLVTLYCGVFDRPPGRSRDPESGAPTGPLLRFVTAAIAELGDAIEHSTGNVDLRPAFRTLARLTPEALAQRLKRLLDDKTILDAQQPERDHPLLSRSDKSAP